MDISVTEPHMYAELIKPADSKDCGVCGHEVDPHNPTHDACFTHKLTGKPKSFWAHGDCCSLERQRRGLTPINA